MCKKKKDKNLKSVGCVTVCTCKLFWWPRMFIDSLSPFLGLQLFRSLFSFLINFYDWRTTTAKWWLTAWPICLPSLGSSFDVMFLSVFFLLYLLSLISKAYICVDWSNSFNFSSRWNSFKQIIKSHVTTIVKNIRKLPKEKAKKNN